jgi:hypothetical protein
MLVGAAAQRRQAGRTRVRHSLTCRTRGERAQRLKKLRAGRTMNRPINPTTPDERLVGRSDDDVNVRSSDVARDDLNLRALQLS